MPKSQPSFLLALAPWSWVLCEMSIRHRMKIECLLTSIHSKTSLLSTQMTRTANRSVKISRRTEDNSNLTSIMMIVSTLAKATRTTMFVSWFSRKEPKWQPLGVHLPSQCVPSLAECYFLPNVSKYFPVPSSPLQ
jgi:hypothetical protein